MFYTSREKTNPNLICGIMVKCMKPYIYIYIEQSYRLLVTAYSKAKNLRVNYNANHLIFD